jgi:hypothetical protein
MTNLKVENAEASQWTNDVLCIMARCSRRVFPVLHGRQNL